VETGGAVEEKTLPLVVGVVADLAPGSPTQERLRDRSFVSVDAENYDAVMAAMSPRLQLSVENRLGTGAKKLNVDLTFSALDSFSPAGVARSVPAIAKLLQTRAKLNDLLAKLEGNERLNDLLAEVVNDETVKAQALKEVRAHSERADAEQPDGPGSSLPNDPSSPEEVR
jgi:type VI secretion system protein ImpB